MPKRKGKSPSIDVMVRFFMQHYEIPTKDDINKILARIDHLESLITSAGITPDRRASGKSGAKAGPPRRTGSMTASDMVLEAIRNFKSGVSFAEIQARTGFEEKKLRNIIFRLNNTGKIRRKARGVYVAADDGE